MKAWRTLFGCTSGSKGFHVKLKSLVDFLVVVRIKDRVFKYFMKIDQVVKHKHTLQSPLQTTWKLNTYDISEPLEQHILEVKIGICVASWVEQTNISPQMLPQLDN